jgi:SAM-dependent methyltransferase
MKIDNDERYLADCLKDFVPAGGGTYQPGFMSLSEVGKNVTLEGVKGLLPSINLFLKRINLPLLSMETYTENNKTEISEQLKEIFTRCGSDKAGPDHCYNLVYGEVFQKFDKFSPLNILEFGLGSQNPEIPSRMASQYKVGGSHRSYKEYFPNAQIFGADIDKDSLFNEERIKTSYVDQLKPETFEEMHESFGSPDYDLIIEDGLHSFTASLNTLNFALKYVKRGGVIVLEDLVNAGNLWNMVFALLKVKGYTVKLINSCGLMLVVYL